MAAAKHIAEVVTFTHDHNNVSVIARSNGKRLVWTLPMEVFEASVDLAGDFLTKCGRKKVVPFRHR